MNKLATGSLIALGLFGLAGGLGCNSSKKSGGNESSRSQAETPPTQDSTLVAVGTEAPDFTAEAHDGSTVQMTKLRGQPVVLYFYPKDETPG